MLLGFGVAFLLRSFNAPEFREFMVTGALGGLSAIVFWLIWKFGGGVDGQRNSSEEAHRWKPNAGS